MPVIYVPSGKAKEYSDLACNLYSGCSHKCKYCVEENTEILMSDFTRKIIKDLKIGDKIVGFDEYAKNGYKKIKKAEILDIIKTKQIGFEITLENDIRIIASANHEFITNRGWKYVSGSMNGKNQRPYLTINNKLFSYNKNVSCLKTSDYKIGYLSGIIKGDGHLKQYNYKRKVHRKGKSKAYIYNLKVNGFRLALKDVEALDRAEKYLLQFGIKVQRFDFNENIKALRFNSFEKFKKLTNLIELKSTSNFYKGWLAGIFDSEGSFTSSIRIFNSDESIINFTKKALNYFKFEYNISEKQSKNVILKTITLKSTLNEIIRFFDLTDVAIKRKVENIYKYRSCLPPTVKIKSIKKTGRYYDMYDITTSSRTFFANGVATHNCYCPAIRRQSLDTWASNPYPRTNILKQLENDAKKRIGEKQELLFCFMSDPYQSDEAAFLTRQALLICEKYQFKNVQILTKAGFRTVKDFDILKRNNWKFGSTIIYRSDELRKEWEPGAPSIESRYEAVKMAHEQGIFTWVSIEPVIDPDEALKVMHDLKGYVIKWKIGKLNHNKEIESKIDWKKFYYDSKEMLQGENVYWKKDLLAYR